MRILHALDLSLPKIAGYSSRSASIVETQRSLGLDAVVVTSPRHPGAVEPCEEIGGVRYYRTLASRDTKRTPFGEMATFYQRILEVAVAERVDVIHAHSPILTGIPAWRAARRLGVPCVYEMRALWEDAAVEKGTTVEGSVRYRLTRTAETFLARRVDALVCICDGLRAEMVGRGLDRSHVHVMPNGVDAARFTARPPDAQLRRSLGLEGRTVVGYVGTFFGYEGVEDLVEALALLVHEGRTDVAGLIVGTGATYEACRQLAHRHGVADRVLHPGHVPPREVERLYSLIDVLAYPRRSYRITELVTPLKPLEAMAMAKAVVGSDVGGMQELIRDGVTGLLHRAGDVRHLAARLVGLLDDPALRARLGRSARDWVVAERDWQHLVPAYVRLYEDVLAARHGHLTVAHETERAPRT